MGDFAAENRTYYDDYCKDVFHISPCHEEYIDAIVFTNNAVVKGPSGPLKTRVSTRSYVEICKMVG